MSLKFLEGRVFIAIIVTDAFDAFDVDARYI